MSTLERQPLPQPEAQPAPVAVQAEALTLYLEALFAEKPASLPVPVITVMPVAPRVIDVVVTRVEAPVVTPVSAPPVEEVVAPVITVVETPTPVVAPPRIEVRAAPPKVEAPVAVPKVEVAVATATGELPRPDWAQAPFQCLLLRMEGLTLALPLVKLNRILPWTELTPIPCYASWLLGVTQVDGMHRQVKVVDTTGFVTPERRPAAPRTPEHIVMIGEGEWALTCEDVSSIITIDPNKVRWRTSRTKRPWLAGTVIEHLCALVDAEELANLLASGAGDLPA